MNQKIDEKTIDQEVIKYLSYVKENLPVLLYIRNYSVAQLAQAIGMRPQTLQDFIDGKDLSTMDMDEFLHISYVLDTPLHWLFLQPDKMRAAAEERYKIKLPPKGKLG